MGSRPLGSGLPTLQLGSQALAVHMQSLPRSNLAGYSLLLFPHGLKRISCKNSL